MEHSGISLTIRSDCGTKNPVVEKLQTSLRKEFSKSNKPTFLYGTSQHNQRIELWWAQLRKHDSQFWLNYFYRMKDDGTFDGSDLDKGFMQLCFGGVIQVSGDLIFYLFQKAFLC